MLRQGVRALALGGRSGKFSVSESTVYRLLKRAGKIPMRRNERVRALKEYTERPARVHDQWQVDFAEFLLLARGRYHDGEVLEMTDHTFWCTTS